jgi:acyl carrier protein
MADPKDLDSIFAEVLEISTGEITDELSPETCAYWDSLNHLRLVTEIESNFGVQFTMAEVQAALSIGKFRQLIAAHAA